MPATAKRKPKEKPAPSATQLYGHLPPGPRRLAAKVHQVLLDIEPEYQFAPAWGGIGYKRKGKYSCVLWGEEDHLKLMISQGIQLKDPKGVLEGSGVNTRHLRFEKPSDLDPAALRALLAQQFALYDSGKTPEKAPAKRTGPKMEAFVSEALDRRKLRAAYDERPAFQRRDYVTWIQEAKRPETRERRLEQMLDELEDGGVYMKMPWKRG